jgi:AcrR family transcriptional regulator
MKSLTSASSPAPTRRARQRAAAIDEIKTLAKLQLAEQGPGALSLRAIAREMGTASSALYRYFPSQGDLITALCVDAYDSAANALIAARAAAPPGRPAGQWLAICLAHRQWSLDHRSDFALLFGTPLPGYQAPEEITGPAAARFTAVPLSVYAAAIGAGAAAPGRTQIPPGLRPGQLWTSLSGGESPDGEPRLAGIVLSAWASVLGYLTAEIFGSLTRLISDTDMLYQAHVRTVMLGMGFEPALIGDE